MKPSRSFKKSETINPPKKKQKTWLLSNTDVKTSLSALYITLGVLQMSLLRYSALQERASRGWYRLGASLASRLLINDIKKRVFWVQWLTGYSPHRLKTELISSL